MEMDSEMGMGIEIEMRIVMGTGSD